jgi:hypothetical protein
MVIGIAVVGAVAVAVATNPYKAIYRRILDRHGSLVWLLVTALNQELYSLEGGFQNTEAYVIVGKYI